MDIDLVTSLGRESMKLAFLIGAPMLTAGIVVGLIVGILQSATQIQDQTIAFVFKLLAVFSTLSIFLPWIVSKTAEFSQKVFSDVPENISSFLK